MKILSAAQIRELDAYTIQNESIPSIDLMERASKVLTGWFIENFSLTEEVIYIFCGPGNNGGDGYAVARLLLGQKYKVKVFRCQIGKGLSPDCLTNYQRLAKIDASTIQVLNKGDNFPVIKKHCILIDAIFGSGLNRPISGYWGGLIQYLNRQECPRVAIDIPSGLFADEHSNGNIFAAQHTLSFELPKLAFLFPENYHHVGNWSYKSISLSQSFIKQAKTSYYYVNTTFAKKLLKIRQKFAHKGNYGHTLLIMGSYGKIGAAILATKACLRTGSGLTTVHLPKCAYEIMQISAPEAMVNIDSDEFYFSEVPDLNPYKAIGIGCGLDQQEQTEMALFQLLKISSIPLVLDADALNLLAKNPDWLKLLPKGSILTPHPKEFERLFGKTSNNFERNVLQQKKAIEYDIYILLKGAHTCITCPDGGCYFNSTGNPGMATAGSGDVLAGIITSLLSQGYSSFEACILGVFLHGLAGDLAVLQTSQEALIASDIILQIGSAFQELKGINYG